ncbi:MAG TPA: hypothetical protein VN826_17105, partial [Candidatus Eisenbacteria bacterium]|nr:hypothetical protein [Candidatus Eisenbacteria bacterium]
REISPTFPRNHSDPYAKRRIPDPTRPNPKTNFPITAETIKVAPRASAAGFDQARQIYFQTHQHEKSGTNSSESGTRSSRRLAS